MKLSRRTLLRGAGAAIALPTLEAMLASSGTALANGTPLPKRYLAWFFGNGVLRSNWTPSATGSGWQLTDELSALTDTTRGFDVKPYVSVVSGYDVMTPNLRGHHNGVAAMMSAAPFIPLPAGSAAYNSKFGMESLDQVIADVIGNTTTFKSLQLAVSKRYTTEEGPTLEYLSHRGPDSPMPQNVNPADVFNQLFANFTPKDPTDPRDRLRVSVLDAVKDDAKRQQLRLGAADRARLDQHLTAISEVRSQILALPPVITSSCVAPTSAVTNTNQDVNGVEQYETVSSIMSNLVALAFACDLTRVVSFQFSGSVGGQCFKDLSPNEPRDNEHSLTHDSTQQDKVNDAVKFTMRNFAYTLSVLQKSLEGTGNVLDNSCVLCTSDVAQGIDHSIDDYPILVAGKAGGALKAGVHVRGSGQNTSDVLLSCAQAVAGLTQVGMNEGLSTTPCAGILV
jgi:hypothetical protein